MICLYMICLLSFITNVIYTGNVAVVAVADAAVAVFFYVADVVVVVVDVVAGIVVFFVVL